MRYWLGLLLMLISLSLTTSGQAEVLLFPVERANVTEDEANVISMVLLDTYEEVSRTELRRAEVMLTEAGIPTGYAETAVALRANEYLVVRAARLDRRILLTVIRYRASGEEIHRVKMPAESMDDVEKVAERISRALHQGKTAEDTRTIHAVTAAETKPENRLSTEKVMGIKVGGTMAFSPWGSFSMISAGFDGRVEAQNYFVEFGTGVSSPGNRINDEEVGAVYVEAGASYYLMDTSVSPYVGAGVIPRILTGPEETANIAAYLQAGVMFFREFSSRIYGDLRIAQNLSPWRKYEDTSAVSYNEYQESWDSEASYSTKTAYPTELSLSVGIGW